MGRLMIRFGVGVVVKNIRCDGILGVGCTHALYGVGGLSTHRRYVAREYEWVEQSLYVGEIEQRLVNYVLIWGEVRHLNRRGTR